MASTIKIPVGYTGGTITCDLFTQASDEAVESGISLTEETNRKGVYGGTATITDTGLHLVKLMDGGELIGTTWIVLTNGGAVDWADDTLGATTVNITTEEINVVSE